MKKIERKRRYQAPYTELILSTKLLHLLSSLSIQGDFEDWEDGEDL